MASSPQRGPRGPRGLRLPRLPRHFTMCFVCTLLATALAIAMSARLGTGGA